MVVLRSVTSLESEDGSLLVSILVRSRRTVVPRSVTSPKSEDGNPRLVTSPESEDGSPKVSN